ncbi:hypothetical protein KSS87_010770 [Heliosperma pusillum]|nr:hypothetical protein KSS87_010770 [Heliosperma pusillum]
MQLTRVHLTLMASRVNPASSIFGSCKPSFIPNKPSYSTLRSNAATCYSCSLVRDGNIWLKGSLIRPRKGRVACRVLGHQCKFDILRDTMSEYKKGSSMYSGSMIGIANYPFSSSRSGFRLSSKGFEPTYDVFARRMFTAKTLPQSDFTGTDTSKAVFANDQKGSENSSKPFVFRKHRKHFKAFATHGNSNTFSGQGGSNTSPDSQLSAHKNVNTVSSSNVLASKEQKEAKSTESLPSSTTDDIKQVSKAEIKQKQKPRTRKKKEEPSDSQSSSESVVAKSSRKAKISNRISPLSPENTSTENIIKEEVDISHSPEASPKKKVTRSRKKEKSVKEDDIKVKIFDGLPNPEESVKEEPSTSKLLQQPKPPIVNGIKSIKLKPLYPPVGKSVVVVESQTKAKVIQRYLGDMYEVLPSYGHVRDLAARSGSVRPDDDFSMVWEVPSPAWTHLKSMKVAISGADNLILASDPDREGEAIAWHIIEMLQQQDALRKGVTVARVTFQEITESAVKSALQTPRDIDVNLVHAYLARRALDYLIGFNISPLLWRKLPGCQSAGRVQSAALALICDREMEIEEFKPQEYWSIEAQFSSKETSLSSNSLVRSYLTRLSSTKLNQFSIGSETEAKSIEQIVMASNFNVSGVKRSKVKRNPPTPYITSTLQQDAANKLNFTAAYTMKLAQKLYEGIEFSDGKAAGLITYMRTDGLHMSDEAAKGICSLITEQYGLDYAASTPRKFFKKVKNAQEAHEAIRPTDIRRFPSMLVGALEEDSLKLYTLIWARTMACQMESAKVDQIQLDVGNDDGSISFRAACSIVSFPGFRSVYEDEETKAIRDADTEASDRDELYNILGNLKQGDQLFLGNMELKQHHTQPPPRYSEASLVKKLEELGIGRPSTYASTIKVLQDRKYVTAKSRVLSPEFRGRMVSAFLSHYFNEVTDYSFTADMETELDNVSGGLTEWKGLLKDYWSRFSGYCDRAGKVHIHQVEKMLERTFGNFLFSSLPDEARTCPSCLEGTLIFKVSRFGAGYFIGCDQHPKCKFIAKTLYGEEEEDEAPQNNNSVEEPKLLGTHPTSGEKVLLKGGPYGSYVQLGEDRKGYSPKRASVSQIKDVGSITLEDALDLLRYPISLGNHPVDGQPVVIKISKVGFTIRHRRNIAPVPKSLPANNITMEKAIELLSGPDVRRCGRPKGKPKHEEAVDD